MAELSTVADILGYWSIIRGVVFDFRNNLGSIAGYFGRVDIVVMRVVDILHRYPVFLDCISVTLVRVFKYCSCSCGEWHSRMLVY